MTQQATELIASQVGSAINNQKTWGTIIYNVKDPQYGAKGNGVTDDTQAIQKAINAASTAGGGTVVLPVGTYKISSTILITQPVMILGSGKGDNTPNTNGSGIGVTTFLWNGLSGGTMFYYKSGISNEYLFGGGLKDCVINGNTTAATGFRGSSVGYMEFSGIEGRNFTTQMGIIDAENGVLAQFNKFEDIHFVYGVSATVENSHGLVFVGNESAGVTQNHIVSITGLIGKGNLLYFGWSDNNIIEKAHGYSPTTGHTVYLSNGNGGNADNNYFQYVVGRIHAESNTYGNTFTHIISEGGGLTVDSGAQLHYVVEDYVNAELFTTHKYVMSDQKDIPIGSLSILDGSATAGIAAAQWPCITLPDGSNSRIGVSIPPPFEWNDGTVTILRIWYTCDTANTSKQWRLHAKALTAANLFGVATPVVDQSFNAPVNDLQYSIRCFDIPLNLIYTKDQLIFLSLERIGADALDTALGNINILGATLYYVGTGPNSPGSGTWAVTNPYK